VALADAPNYAIPWREGLDDEGRLTREVAPEYRDLCRVARGLWEAMEQNGRLVQEEDDIRRACATARCSRATSASGHMPASGGGTGTSARAKSATRSATPRARSSTGTNCNSALGPMRAAWSTRFTPQVRAIAACHPRRP
jgi:hypothetical protein